MRKSDITLKGMKQGVLIVSLALIFYLGVQRGIIVKGTLLVIQRFHFLFFINLINAARMGRSKCFLLDRPNAIKPRGLF